MTPAQSRQPTSSTLPPVVLYLPGLAQSEINSASRIADLMAIKASKGPGTYTTEAVPSRSRHLTDGRRIIAAGDGPVLDIYTVDYRPRLRPTPVSGDGTGAVLRRFALALWYFARALVLVLSASRRAKSRLAKCQLLIGLGGAFVLLLSLVFTALAVMAALGLWTQPRLSENAADAIALGATALTTWLFFSARPAILRAATLIEQLLDYAQDERHAHGVVGILDSALDDLIEAAGTRPVHLFGYSLGGLVALDFLHPRSSLHQPPDVRHARAVSTLVTVGCPLDFIRLYAPDYTDGREARVPDLKWTNVYIAADVLGSNLIDGDDFAEVAAAHASAAGAIAGTRPVSKRYTSERLTFRNIWGRRGLLAHTGYWDEPDRENCLHLVMQEVLPSAGSVADGV